MRILTFAMLLASAALIGCGAAGGSTPDGGKSPGDQVRVTPTKPGNGGDKIDVEYASWQETEKMIAGDKGKVVVIDLWATT